MENKQHLTNFIYDCIEKNINESPNQIIEMVEYDNGIIFLNIEDLGKYEIKIKKLN